LIDHLEILDPDARLLGKYIESRRSNARHISHAILDLAPRRFERLKQKRRTEPFLSRQSLVP